MREPRNVVALGLNDLGALFQGGGAAAKALDTHEPKPLRVGELRPKSELVLHHSTPKGDRADNGCHSPQRAERGEALESVQTTPPLGIWCALVMSIEAMSDCRELRRPSLERHHRGVETKLTGVVSDEPPSTPSSDGFGNCDVLQLGTHGGQAFARFSAGTPTGATSVGEPSEGADSGSDSGMGTEVGSTSMTRLGFPMFILRLLVRLQSNTSA
jgi:hypothetical protein